MPHVVYLGTNVFCPWPGCNYQIEIVDFRLETLGNPALYGRVMTEWGRLPGFGLIGRCPGCNQYVLFGVSDKAIVNDVSTTILPVLADDWYMKVQVG
jgi:hypothetical protein